jgi:hypothetical protein
MGLRAKGNVREIRARAEELVQLGFGVGDAADLAFASFQNAEFITCDDSVISPVSASRLSSFWYE